MGVKSVDSRLRRREIGLFVY